MDQRLRVEKLVSKGKQGKKEAKQEATKRIIKSNRDKVRNQLNRETHLAKGTVKRHEKSWKQLLLKIILPGERLNAEIVWQSWERLADAKDFTISLLMDELRMAQDNRIHLFSSAVENIQKLMDLFTIEWKNMDGSFNESVEELKNQIRSERRLLRETLSTLYHQLVMIFGLEKQKKEYDDYIEVNIKHIFQEKEIMFLKALNEYKDEQDHIIDSTMVVAQDAFNEYHNYITPKRTKFEKAVEIDKIGRKLIKRRVITIKHMLRRIFVMKYNYNMSKSNLETKKENILQRKNFNRDGLLTLRTLQRNTFQVEEENMRKLVVKSDDLIERLVAMEAKGEKILRMMQVCKRLEVQEEAILAMPLEKPCDNVKAEEYEENVLKTFFTKVGQADEKRLDLIGERNYLKKENFELRKKIETFCKCLTFPRPKFTKKSDPTVKPNFTEGSEVWKKYDLYTRSTVRWNMYVVE